MQEANPYVMLKKDGVKENKFTSAKLTYIHTYGKSKFEPTLGFSVGTDTSLAASVTLQDYKESWQIEISVGKIEF